MLFRSEEENRFEIFALREIEEGEEICLHYGYRRNLDLLIGYGFTLKDNEYNEFYVKHPKINVLLKFTEKDSFLSLRNIDEPDPEYPSSYLELKRNIRKICTRHQINCKKIKNKNIRQIFLDEIKIMKRLLH